MSKGVLLLTSTGLSSDNIAKKFRDLFSDLNNQSVAIVTTAAEDKERNRYSQLAKEQLENIGFVNIDFVDLETEPTKDFSQYTVIYVCGGNTFKLLKFAREADFGSSIKNLLKRGGVYLGVSAGSIIVGPSITIAGEIEPDINEVRLKDLTGFGITDLVILPHYSPELETETITFENKYSVKVKRLSDYQAILIENNKETLIK